MTGYRFGLRSLANLVANRENRGVMPFVVSWLLRSRPKLFLGAVLLWSCPAHTALARGYLCKEIADRLNITGPTVNTYVRRMYEKLHVRSRARAVAKYAHFSDTQQAVPGSIPC